MRVEPRPLGLLPIIGRPMSDTTTTSERWFDEYLRTNGYDFEVEPDLGVRTRPDRVIRRVDAEAICEIKEFTTDAMRRRFPEGGSGFSSFSSNEWLLNVRRAITEAASQLEPLAADPRPLVIVLANPRGVIAEVDDHHLIEAMYGDLVVRFNLNIETGGPASDPEWVLGGGGGRLGEEKAPWVSAVVGLHRGDRQRDWQDEYWQAWKVENWPEGLPSDEEAPAVIQAYQGDLDDARKGEDVPSGEYLFLHVVETQSDTAAPLPRNILDGEGDRRWVLNREQSRYELLTSPEGEVPPTR
jgi:hypothetical protein